jgi:hypothetical protein
MSHAPMYEAIRRETSRKPLIRGKSAEFWGTGHQCKDGYCHQLSVIFESVKTSIRIVGFVPWGCNSNLYPCFKHSMAFYSITYIKSAVVNIVIDGKIHHLMCDDTYSLNCIHFLL